MTSTYTGKLSRLIAILLSFIVLGFLSACTDSDPDFVAQLAKSWALENKIINADGSLNLVTLGSKAFLGTTGNPEVDAALDAASVMLPMQQADKLAQEGSQLGGEAGILKIDQAIALRPQDWSYREQKAAVLLASGDAQGAQQAAAEAEGVVKARIQKGENCKVLTRNWLAHRAQAINAQIAMLNANTTLNAEEKSARLANLSTAYQNANGNLQNLETNPTALCP